MLPEKSKQPILNFKKKKTESKNKHNYLTGKLVCL